MKDKIFITVLGLLIFVGCSHFQDTSKRVPSSIAKPCGLKGSVNQRINNCAKQEGSLRGNFILVTRTKNLNEIYKDNKSGLIWGDRLPNVMFQDDGLSVCNNKLAEVGGIKSSWRLPTREEFEEAERNEVRTSLPNMKKTDKFGSYEQFMSSTVEKGNPMAGQWVFDVGNGSLELVMFTNDDVYAVRCVTR